MINLIKLTDTIDKKGLKRTYIAKEVGISIQTLSLKLKGQTDFKISELQKLCDLLELKLIDILNIEEEN